MFKYFQQNILKTYGVIINSVVIFLDLFNPPQANVPVYIPLKNLWYRKVAQRTGSTEREHRAQWVHKGSTGHRGYIKGAFARNGSNKIYPYAEFF